MSDDGRNIIGIRIGRWTTTMALALAVSAGVAAAEEATSSATAATVAIDSARQQAAEQQQGGSAAPTTRPTAAGGRLRHGAGAELPTDEEWRGAVEFMNQYSPNRMKVIEAQRTADGPRYAGLRRVVWGHYRDLMALKEKGDQELYDLRVKLVQADDDVWGAQRKLREASDNDRPILRHQLRQKVADMVKLGLKDRELRIARLEKALADEKAKLAADEKNIDQRVEERMRALRSGPASGNRPERRRDDTATGTDRGPATDTTSSQVK